MKATARYLVMLLIVAAGVAALVWAFIPDPIGVDVAEIAKGRLLVTVDEDGKTRIRERYIVSTPLTGRLLRIELDPGDPVEKDKTLLATIEPRDPELLDPRTFALAEARVRAYEAALEKTIPLIEQARERQAYAERELKRARELKQRNAISQSQFDETILQDRLAAEQLRSARTAQDIARFELEQAQAALLRSRPDGPGRDDPHGEATDADANSGTDSRQEEAKTADDEWTYRIYAPISGRVLQVFQESTAVVTAGMHLLELGEPADLEIVVDVLSQDAVAIESDDRVLLEHWGGEQPLEGRVRLVEPAAFTKISTLGVEEQRVNVIIDLVDPAAERTALGDGFRVEARIVTWETDDALKVPTSALFRYGDDWAVFRINVDRAERTIVTLGNRNGLEANVTSGLAAGDRVIVHPSDSVRDGVRVAER